MGHELIDDRFRTGQVIGKGNMGEVHRAEDLQAPGLRLGRATGSGSTRKAHRSDALRVPENSPGRAAT